MGKDEIYNIIGRRLAGEMSEIEIQQFENWLSDDTSNQSMYEMMQKSWEVESEIKARQQQGRLFDKIVNEIGKDKFYRYGKQQLIPMRRFLNYAAAIILVIISSVVIKHVYEQQTKSNHQVKLITKSNPRGQKSIIHLSDGSKVVLNAGSILTYPATFAGNTRKINLVGEAYFDVVSNPDQPFIVTSNNVTVTALGTAFNVNSFDRKVQVALVEGSVEVTTSNDLKDTVLLKPGEMASVMTAEGDIAKSGFDTELAISWVSGKLVFKDASMNEIIDKLEKWYGVDIEVKGLHGHTWNYNGKFNNEHLSRVLTSMSIIHGFEYQIKDKKVVIEPSLK